jgi:hypothetical protein
LKYWKQRGLIYAFKSEKKNKKKTINKKTAILSPTYTTLEQRECGGASNKARGQVWQPRETPHILESFSILILINQPKKTNLALMVSEITKKKTFLKV